MIELFLTFGLIGYVTGAFLAAGVADGKGRSTFGWLCVAVICSPLLALIALAALPDKVK